MTYQIPMDGDRVDMDRIKMDSGKLKTNTSGYKGVSFDVARRKFQARIWHGGKCLFLGRFEDKEDAHAAYADAATKLFGDFARIA